MSDCHKLAVLTAFSLFGIAVSFSSVPLWAAAVGAVLGFAVLLPALKRVLPRTHQDLWELAPVAAFSPLIWLRITTPGADAAMYAAIARALLRHSPELSTAYPGVRVAIYPRAFPGLVALLTPAVGMPKANLVAAVLCYVVFVMGLAFWLRTFVPPRAALISALVIALVSRNVPLGFFSWGGNPTILAFGMALCAIVLAADATHARIVLCGALILGGAFATHTIGAFGGAACAPLVLLRPGSRVRRAGRIGVLVVAVAPLLLSFKRFGPEISPRESEWIAHWQDGAAHLIRDRFGFFGLDYLEAFTRTCGPVLTMVVVLCVARAVAARQHRLELGLLAAGLCCVAALMTIGPHLPLLGTFIYADRLSPMWLVALGPLLAVTLVQVRLPPRVALVGACALLGMLAHVNFRLGEPFVDDDELALTPCIRDKVPPDAWVVASYGQGGQWLPALTGNPITQAHTHCSLFDETDATRGTVQARYQFLSSHAPQFTTTLVPELPAAETVCEHGGAKLVRLLTVAPPIAGVY
jgi:hypothetical protein